MTSTHLHTEKASVGIQCFKRTFLVKYADCESGFCSLPKNSPSPDPELVLGWIIAPVLTPCFSGFRTPLRGNRRGRQKGGMEKLQQEHFLIMIHRPGPYCGGKVRMSHYFLVCPFIAVQVGTWGCSIRDLLLFSCFQNYDIAPLLLHVRTAWAAIWLWVMEGGLNSPFEILEPVGKPQLFKCRKSWFYKMLIWSTLGKSKQKGSEKTHPPTPNSLFAHLLSRVERRGGKKNLQTSLVFDQNVLIHRKDEWGRGRNRQARRGGETFFPHMQDHLLQKVSR